VVFFEYSVSVEIVGIAERKNLRQSKDSEIFILSLMYQIQKIGTITKVFIVMYFGWFKFSNADEE
jgi:hypothetical protein